MDRHDERAAAEERLQHESPARPEQQDEGYGRGLGHPDEGPEEELEPNFARGQSAEDIPGTEEQGRFSQGQEVEPEHTPDKDVERRFSEGQERSPTSN